MTGPSATVASCASVTSSAISMIRSESGCSPVISMSIQIRLFWSTGMLYSLMVTNAFAWVFLLALGLATATRLWLALRQIRHVRAHRDAVPRTLAAALGLPLLILVLWLMAKMGALWWLYVWIAWMAFNLLVLLIFPTFIAPLFNRFTKLEDAGLAGRIEALLRRCGFRASGLYVMDGSKRSSHGNAYFTGFGAAKRIVLFDTLLSRLAPPEVEAVLAHELGHYRRHHVWKRMALLFGLSLALLWGLGRLVGEAWFYDGLGVASRGTAVALLLFVLVLPVFTFFLQPVSSLYSRRHEFEADAYAADHSDAAELVKALVKLYQDNAATLTPDPLHSAFYDSHPPAAIRIARLRTA